MSKLEQFQLPSFEDHDDINAEAVTDRLTGQLNSFLQRHGPMLLVWTGIGATAGVTAGSYLNKRDNERYARGEFKPTLDVDIRFDQLHALDPEASPERIQRLLETLPDGFVRGEVASIGFTDEKREMPASYGSELHLHQESAATASGGQNGHKTEITFWRGVKTSPSKEIWGRVALHEFWHANDWGNNHQLNGDERELLQRSIYLRVQAPDCFPSGYVQSISNPDKKIELSNKATEYWAEIGEAYLSGKAMPEKDAELVRNFIARQDPNFDRDAALRAREAILQEMAVEERMAAEYQALTPNEQELIEAWVEWRVHLESAKPDIETQRAGREALVTFLKREGTTELKQEYLFNLMDVYGALQNVFHERQARSNKEVWALQAVGSRYKNLDQSTAKLGEVEASSLRREFEDIIRSHGIWIDGDDGDMKLLPGEYGRLFPDRGRNTEDAWTRHLQTYLGWNPVADKQVDEFMVKYFGRMGFNLPDDEEAPSNDGEGENE